MFMRKLLTATAIAVMAGSAMGADYLFPSPVNPAGKDPADVTQYVLFIWDDNAYSGLNGTTYEYQTEAVAWDKGAGVGGADGVTAGGFPSWSPAANPNNLNKNLLDIEEGDMGMSWAVETLGAVGGGNRVKMTFNMITGLFIPTADAVATDGWKDRSSELGYYVPNTADNVDHTKIAVAWGREQETYANSTEQIIPPVSVLSVQNAIDAGHEIGNHTIDHMESNSVLPGGESKFAQNGFGLWDDEGFDFDPIDTTPWGISTDEAKEYGQTPGASAQTMGWLTNAGRMLGKDAWKKYLELSETWLTKTSNELKNPVGVSGITGKFTDKSALDMQGRGIDIFGFRAPRLEVNSAMFYALAELDYLYDCGLEEGYEAHRDGENFVWPYTTDNGAVNQWTQYSMGARSQVDSMPMGLWQIPTNVVIVPENIRSDVFANYRKVMVGSGESVTDADRDSWLENGKITAFDFNTFILWGMTAANWQTTMRHTLDLRMSGNKAPIHYGAHTDYYTPIYDNATLLKDPDAWGLCVVEGWNTWRDRTAQMEKFTTYALGRGAEFVTGKTLIDELKTLAAEGVAKKGSEINMSGANWVFSANNDLGDNKSTTTQERFSGIIEDAKVTVAAPQGGNYPAAKYSHYFTDGHGITDLTHISLDYKSTGATAIRLAINDGSEWGQIRQVILTHRKSNEYRSSGLIPIHAFDYEEHYEGTRDYNTPIDPAKITGIEILPLAPSNKAPVDGQAGTYTARTKAYDITFSLRNIKLYGEADILTPIADLPKVNAGSLNIASMSANALKLNIGTAGKYNVQIFSASGRMLNSFGGEQFTSGINTLKLNNLASGIYMIRIQNLNTNQLLNKSALVM